VSSSADSLYSRVVTTTPIATVLGINCKRLRTEAGITQDELAKAARRVGLRWTPSKVRDFEAGRSAPTFATVLALAAALDSVITTRMTAQATQTGVEIAVHVVPVRLVDLVRFNGDVTITEDFWPTGDRLADFCSGGTWEHTESVVDSVFESVFDWSQMLGLTEERLAAGLGISTDRLGAEALRLWNTTFSAQRDRLAGPDANPQRKGRITRQLKAELEKVLTDGDD
jgi:transcriptional regulator with XRE-family HTH domain